MVGDTQLPSSNTWHNGWNPGMRVWSERTITHKGKPDEIMRMTGKVVGVTSRLIVPNQASNDPIDTPLVEVLWDGAKSTVLLLPSELHIQSDEQPTDGTPALVDEAAATPEVAEELVGESTDPKLEAGTETIAQEVRDMTASVDNTSASAVEVVEELTEEEEADRHRLELKVERAFREAGLALAQLRNRRLYRSTHKTWEAYCKDRFGYGRDSADLRILAAAVVEEIERVPTNRRQILPTTLEQVRPLTKLAPDEQREVWQQAVEEAGGKIPSGRIVKGIVERLKQRDTTPPPIPFQEGDVVLIRGMGNPEIRKFDGQWAIALRINEYSVTLALDGKDVPVKPQFLEPVDPKYWAEIKAVHERITRLQQYELDPMEDAGLEVLRRRTCFTPKQMMLLERMELDYAR